MNFHGTPRRGGGVESPSAGPAQPVPGPALRALTLIVEIRRQENRDLRKYLDRQESR